jgi:SNF2 family DNA or RNA helicase
MCTDEGWSYVTYHGKMSHEARERAIVDFQSPEKNKQIMLASLKTGGLGLNLVMAARVLTIDPWWNSCTESQAFCRVFRIGQERTTQLCRLIVRNTIDEKMEAIKKRKDREINGLMDSPALTDTLKFDELLGLFGTVEHDTAGRPFIVANSEVQGRLGQPGGTSIANQLNVEGTWRNEE